MEGSHVEQANAQEQEHQLALSRSVAIATGKHIGELCEEQADSIGPFSSIQSSSHAEAQIDLGKSGGKAMVAKLNDLPTCAIDMFANDEESACSEELDDLAQWSFNSF